MRDGSWCILPDLGMSGCVLYAGSHSLYVLCAFLITVRAQGLGGTSFDLSQWGPILWASCIFFSRPFFISFIHFAEHFIIHGVSLLHYSTLHYNVSLAVHYIIVHISLLVDYIIFCMYWADKTLSFKACWSVIWTSALDLQRLKSQTSIHTSICSRFHFFIFISLSTHVFHTLHFFML